MDQTRADVLSLMSVTPKPASKNPAPERRTRSKSVPGKAKHCSSLRDCLSVWLDDAMVPNDSKRGRPAILEDSKQLTALASLLGGSGIGHYEQFLLADVKLRAMEVCALLQSNRGALESLKKSLEIKHGSSELLAELQRVDGASELCEHLLKAGR